MAQANMPAKINYSEIYRILEAVKKQCEYIVVDNSIINMPKIIYIKNEKILRDKYPQFTRNQTEYNHKGEFLTLITIQEVIKQDFFRRKVAMKIRDLNNKIHVDKTSRKNLLNLLKR